MSLLHSNFTLAAKADASDDNSENSLTYGLASEDLLKYEEDAYILSEETFTQVETIKDLIINCTGNCTMATGLLIPEGPVYEPPQYMFVTVTLFYILIFVIGLVGNILVIFVVCKNRDMRNSTNLFLLNLSIADVLVVLICMPAGAVEFYGKDVWHLGEGLCKTVPFLENTVAHASVSIILAITFDRYYAICHPLKAQYTCTTGRTIKTIIVIWCVAVISCLPLIFITQEQDANFFDGTPVKVCSADMDAKWKQIYALIIVCLFFAVPFMMLLILYALICRELMSDPRMFRRSDSQDSATSNNMRQRRQVVYMLIGVILLFFVCLMPFRVVSFWHVYTPIKEQEKLGFEGYHNLFYFARIMVYINSATNPILYNVISSKFREAFKKALGIGKGGVRRQSTLTTYVSLRRKSSTCHTDSITVSVNSNNANVLKSETIALNFIQAQKVLPSRGQNENESHVNTKKNCRSPLHGILKRGQTPDITRTTSVPELLKDSVPRTNEQKSTP